MGDNDRIKVVGYAQRVFYDDGIEYRNFSDDLVGNQQTSDADGINSSFTFGNFVTTVNFEGRISRLFSTKKFSKYYTLSNLNLDEETANTLLNNNINTTINVDRSELCNFAYFGSATEYIRVSLEKIITDWPASLYLNPFRNTSYNTVMGDTFNDYTYNINNNVSTFNVDTNFIINNFLINYNKNGSTINNFSDGNDLRNLTVNFFDYVILKDGLEYPIIGFTGSSKNLNDTIYFKVLGDPFKTFQNVSGTTGNTPTYHIKPKDEFVEGFFNSLNEFESYLLNRLSTPKYTSKYKFKVQSDNGAFVDGEKTLTWPTTDGYNIDFNTTEYGAFVGNLLEVTNNKDISETNLMTRFLTSESISDFDTVPRCDGDEEPTAGQKMNKTLKIYGREFDEIKKYTDGISFANTVSYDKKNNTPDQLVKYLARVLGWELTSSIVENDLINNYLKLGSKTYPGYSRGLSPSEAETELWRRLILNSSFIWKSKGTRKAIEFFFRLIGTPDGLIDFNEHIYLAKEPIDMDLFYKVLKYNNLPDDLSLYNVDADGFPKFFSDNKDMYFQKGGGWYRQTAGSAATQYELIGNNPHIGPYDSGYEYISQLENIIPSFSAFTITATTTTSGNTNLFTNYNSGLINQYNGPTYVEPKALDGSDLKDSILLDTRVVTDICPTAEETDCGCDVPENDESLIIDVERLSQTISSSCDETKIESVNFNNGLKSYEWNYFTYNINGEILDDQTIYSLYVSPQCCKTFVNGNSYYYDYYTLAGGSQGREERNLLIKNDFKSAMEKDINLDLLDCGYICCSTENKQPNDLKNEGCGCSISRYWELRGPTIGDLYIDFLQNGAIIYYLLFNDPQGNIKLTNEADSAFCPAGTGLVTPRRILDPITGKQGYACSLTSLGLTMYSEASTKDTNWLYVLYKLRKWGIEDCGGWIKTMKELGDPSDLYTKSLYE